MVDGSVEDLSVGRWSVDRWRTSWFVSGQLVGSIMVEGSVVGSLWVVAEPVGGLVVGGSVEDLSVGW